MDAFFSKLYELSPQETGVALCNRAIYRILCCDEKMQQIFVRGFMPTDERKFGVSQILLKCFKCSHQIQVEVSNTHAKRYEDMVAALDQPIVSINKER